MRGRVVALSLFASLLLAASPSQAQIGGLGRALKKKAQALQGQQDTATKAAPPQAGPARAFKGAGGGMGASDAFDEQTLTTFLQVFSKYAAAEARLDPQRRKLQQQMDSISQSALQFTPAEQAELDRYQEFKNCFQKATSEIEKKKQSTAQAEFKADTSIQNPVARMKAAKQRGDTAEMMRLMSQMANDPNMMRASTRNMQRGMAAATLSPADSAQARSKCGGGAKVPSVWARRERAEADRTALQEKVDGINRELKAIEEESPMGLFGGRERLELWYADYQNGKVGRAFGRVEDAMLKKHVKEIAAFLKQHGT